MDQGYKPLCSSTTSFNLSHFFAFEFQKSTFPPKAAAKKISQFQFFSRVAGSRPVAH
jgi:hypothetical protein